MADVIGFAGEVPFDQLDALAHQRVTVAQHDRRLALGAIFLDQIGTQLAAVDQHVVDATLAQMMFEHAQEVLDSKAAGFPVLGHHVADVDEFGTGRAQRVNHPRAEQVRHDAGVKIAGADDDVVGVGDGLARTRIEAPAAEQEGLADRDVAIVLGDVDIRLADNLLAVLQRHAEAHVVERDGNDLAVHVEHVG